MLVLIGQTCLAQGGDHVPDEVIVVARKALVYDKKNSTVKEIMPLFPIGSRIIGCADMPLLEQDRAQVADGKYFGTTFLIKLPAPTAATIVADSFNYFKSGWIKNIWLNTIAKGLSSDPLPFDDPTFPQMQWNIFYYPLGISMGVKYSGWQHVMGYIPKNQAKVPVAVLDMGLNFNHQDAQGAYWVNNGEIPGNNIDDDANGYIDDWRGYDFYFNDNDPTDDHGHGSHCFGIIAARNNNNKNICGVIKDSASCMALKVGTNNFMYDFANTAAYNYALAKGCKVFSMSFGGNNSQSSLAAAIANGVANYKAVPVASAGNDGTYMPNIYPTNFPNVIGVGANLNSGTLCSFSSYSDSLDICYYGCSNVQSLDWQSNTATVPKQGTSMAGPGIAGFCWWLKKIDSTLTVSQVTQLIRSCGNNNGTFNMQTGYGIFVRFDSLLRKFLLPDTVLTFASCSGKKSLPHSRYFQLVDSAWIGNAAIVGDSINTNYLSAGTYQCYFTWKSEPRSGEYYLDTIGFKVIITGSGGTVPAATTISASGTQFCAGSSYSLNCVAQTGAAITWYMDGVQVGTGSTLSQSPGAGMYTYYAIADVTSLPGCWAQPADTSGAVVITVFPVLAPNAAISGPSSICQGATASYSATTNISSPTYQWQVNGVNAGSNSANFSYTPANGDIVTCLVYVVPGSCYSAGVANSNTITVTLNPNLTPTASFTVTPDSVVCVGDSYFLNANSNVPGVSYQWYLNGSAFGPSLATFGIPFAPLGTYNYHVVTTMPVNGCFTSNTATSSAHIVQVVNQIAPTISIAASANNVCVGTAVTFTATTTAGGTSPGYQWKVNGVNAGGNSPTYTSSSFANGDIVTCVLTSNFSCASVTTVTSAPVTMTISTGITPTANISPGSVTICATGGSATLTATTNVTAPTYQWYQGSTAVGAGGSTLNVSGLPAGNYNFSVVVSAPVNSCYSPQTTTSNIAAVTVTIPVIPASAASASSITICSTDTDTLSAICSVSSVSWQWQQYNGSTWDNITGATAATYIVPAGLSGTNQFRCIVTLPLSSCYIAATDTTNVVTINASSAAAIPAYTVSGVAVYVSQNVYDGMYTANIPSGITAYTLGWYLNGSYILSTLNSNSWTHSSLDNTYPDTVHTILTPDGCFMPDSLISDTVILGSPVNISHAFIRNDIRIYPNPIRNNNIFIVEGLFKGDRLVIFDVVGRSIAEHQIKQNGKELVNIGDLPKGVYILRITTAQNNMVMKKLEKQ